MITTQARQFAIDVSWAFASSIITIPLSFILRVFLARWLGAPDLGLFQMVVTIYGITMILATFGIPASIIKFAAEFQSDPDTLDQYVTTGILSSVFYGCLVCVAMYALSNTISRLFHMPELSGLLKILALIYPFTSVFQTSTGLLNGLRVMRRYASLIMLQSLSMIVFTVALVGMGLGVQGAVSGLVAGMAFTCVVSLASTKRFFRINTSGLAARARALLRYGALLLGSDAMNILAANADIVLLGYFLTKTDVGIYSVAVTLSMILTFIPTAVQRITYPATSEFHARQNTRQLSVMLDKSMKYTTIVLLPLALVMGFHAGPLIGLLFGGQYASAATALIILVIGRVVRGGVNASIGALFTGVGRPEVSFALEAATSLATVALLILLIPRFGIEGAALSTCLAYLAGTLLFAVLMPRVTGYRMDVPWYARVACLAAGLAGMFMLLSPHVNGYAVGLIALLLYCAAIWRFFLTANDIVFIRSYAETVRKRFTRT
jgi:O-antigen/teichoic acid export membrane protein